MTNVLNSNPWVILPAMFLLIPIFGVIFGTVTNYLTAVRKAELEASLKHQMLERGMSAEEIRTVIEATGRRKGGFCKSDSGTDSKT